MSSSASTRHVSSFVSLERALFWAPLLMAVGFYVMRHFHRDFYYQFVREDGPAEDFQALCLLTTSALGAVLSRRLWRRRQTFLGAVFGLFALTAFAAFGEEISWGQRIFGWNSGEYFQQVNMQQETNLHNDARLGLIMHPLMIAIGTYAVLSAFAHGPLIKRRLYAASHFTTELPLLGYFAVFTAVYTVYQYLNPFIRPYYGGFDLILWQDLELAETFFYSGVLAWTCLKLRSVDLLFRETPFAKTGGLEVEKTQSVAR